MESTVVINLATTFLEGMSHSFDTRRCVVSCVNGQAAGFCVGLPDEIGHGSLSIFHEIEVPAPAVRHRHERHISGIGDFKFMAWLATAGES
jgi:hypothetical protein